MGIQNINLIVMYEQLEMKKDCKPTLLNYQVFAVNSPNLLSDRQSHFFQILHPEVVLRISHPNDDCLDCQKRAENKIFVSNQQNQLTLKFRIIFTKDASLRFDIFNI